MDGDGGGVALTTTFLTTGFFATGFFTVTALGAGFFTAEKEVVGSKRVNDIAQTKYFFIILTSWPWLYLPLHLSKERQ
jgi:hypothetical protein